MIAMCLAVPGKVLAVSGDEAVVDLQGNRLRVCTALTPDVGVDAWVLVHAGFAIVEVDEADAMETWDYLRDNGVESSVESEGLPP